MDQMSEIMRRLMSRTQNVFDEMSRDESSSNINPRLKQHMDEFAKSVRGQNHDQLAFIGPSVGNTDTDGNVILHVQIPVGG